MVLCIAGDRKCNENSGGTEKVEADIQTAASTRLVWPKLGHHGSGSQKT